ncbi:uncharacterized protein PV07_08667 [Cladophialophora immunda]|uniref:Uncharacterized protein n=1 Tax=Cladophialophora immunda TaxID=569365 RepID=A0A0D1ZCR6_9EURO|nr:uncharacterized protein PV07_08667 [Cladophialophora immunda]KIW25501.1 hypothetical protein PV07_08667 [Cladophialophora immunda]
MTCNICTASTCNIYTATRKVIYNEEGHLQQGNIYNKFIQRHPYTHPSTAQTADAPPPPTNGCISNEIGRGWPDQILLPPKATTDSSTWRLRTSTLDSIKRRTRIRRFGGGWPTWLTRERRENICRRPPPQYESTQDTAIQDLPPHDGSSDGERGERTAAGSRAPPLQRLKDLTSTASIYNLTTTITPPPWYPELIAGGLVQFILPNLRNTQARELKEKRINKDLANIRQKSKSEKLDGYQKKKSDCNVDIGHTRK